MLLALWLACAVGPVSSGAVAPRAADYPVDLKVMKDAAGRPVYPVVPTPAQQDFLFHPGFERWDEAHGTVRVLGVVTYESILSQPRSPSGRPMAMPTAIWVLDIAGLEAACGGRPAGPVKLRVEVVGVYYVPAYSHDTSLMLPTGDWDRILTYVRVLGLAEDGDATSGPALQ